MATYTKQQIEDVAGIVAEIRAEALDKGGMVYTVSAQFALRFADLFAADNPPTCTGCYARLGDDTSTGHTFEGGFDRKGFLEGCGLTAQPAVDQSMAEKA